MTKRRPNGHKKSGKGWHYWLRRLGGGAAVVVALAVVVLAVFGMTRAGGNEDSTRPDITPVAEETTEGTTTRQGGPAISFDAKSVDFGDVPLNTPVSYAFEFANTGDATLQIEDVQVKTLEGCWPFQPVVGSTTLKPGEESEISFTTQMHEGMEGPHLFEIAVKCNDPQEPVHKLLVKANFGP